MSKKEKKITESKSVIIDASLHGKLKSHCVSSGRTMGRVLENLIKLYLGNTKKYQDEIDNLNKVITQQ